MTQSLKKEMSTQRNWTIFRLRGMIATVESLCYDPATPDETLGALHSARSYLTQALNISKKVMKDEAERKQKKTSSAG